MTEEATMIFVLYGGVGSEREVSLRTGEAVIAALEPVFPLRPVELTAAKLPEGLDPLDGIVFPALHGDFGEDGRLQSLLEKGGYEYAGSDSISSALCMDKAQTKERAIEAGILCATAIVTEPGEIPDAVEICERLGRKVVVKPVDGGSSTNLYIVEGAGELQRCLGNLPNRRWMLETFVEGREVSIGLLNGVGQGVVEILPEGGIYDYKHKYTAGMTEYRAPAVLDQEEESAIRNAAETLFAVCGCRDFARIDFRLTENGPIFLEINTLPGLTSESLLPRSAGCRGLSFEDLAVELVRPAINRFRRRGR